MTALIRSIEKEARTISKDSAAMMVNRLVEIDNSGDCRHYDYP